MDDAECLSLLGGQGKVDKSCDKSAWDNEQMGIEAWLVEEDYLWMHSISRIKTD